MIEATRLTREGRLKEAMAVLRGVLAPTSTVRSDVARDASDTRSILDMVPPEGPGGAWTAPPSADRPGGASRSRTPAALRELLAGMGQIGSARGFDGRMAPAMKRRPVPVPDGARFEERSYANAAGSRAYKLYVPSGFDGQALPLVVMLHGCTQSPDDFAAGTRMNELAEEHTFLVAYPAQHKSANASKCWNWFNASDQRREQGEPSLIAGITREVMRDMPVAHGRVYIAGLSAGGAAAAVMGTTYPDLYAAVGVHSGLACGAASDIASAFAAMRQGASAVRAQSRRHGSAVPTIVFHGDRDTTVNPINADHIIAQSMGDDLRTTATRGEASGGVRYTRTVHTDDSGRAILEQWVLHGGGHAWSGGSTSGSYTDPRGPDASREMLRFFLQHPAASASLS
jgi:poly(hydroxyalkanoate) depolymerase family esterase